MVALNLAPYFQSKGHPLTELVEAGHHQHLLLFRLDVLLGGELGESERIAYGLELAGVLLPYNLQIRLPVIGRKQNGLVTDLVWHQVFLPDEAESHRFYQAVGGRYQPAAQFDGPSFAVGDAVPNPCKSSICNGLKSRSHMQTIKHLDTSAPSDIADDRNSVKILFLQEIHLNNVGIIIGKKILKLFSIKIRFEFYLSVEVGQWPYGIILIKAQKTTIATLLHKKTGKDIYRTVYTTAIGGAIETVNEKDIHDIISSTPLSGNS